MDCYRLRNSSDIFSHLLVARIVTTVVSSASTPCCGVTSPVAMLHVAVRPERLGASNGWPVPKEGAGPEGCEANRGSCQARPPRDGVPGCSRLSTDEDCEQYPPRSAVQQRRQTPQDLRHEKQKNNHASKHKHRETHRSSATFMMIDNTDNTNDAQSII